MQDKEKKVTLRFLANNEYQMEIHQKIVNRDLNRYKTIMDYICAAVGAFETEQVPEVRLSDKDRHRLVEELRNILNEYSGKEVSPRRLSGHSEPGI